MIQSLLMKAPSLERTIVVFGSKEEMEESMMLCKCFPVQDGMIILIHSLLSRFCIDFRRKSQDLWVNWNAHNGSLEDKKSLANMGWRGENSNHLYTKIGWVLERMVPSILAGTMQDFLKKYSLPFGINTSCYDRKIITI